MKKIRVLHYGLSSHLGGIETYLKKITSFIDKNAFEFGFLIVGEEKPCFYDELISMGCSFFYITPRRKNFIKNYLDLINLFKAEKFDIVHCHLNSLSYITPILVAYNYGCQVIAHSRNAGLKASIPVRLRHKINYYRLPKKNIKCVAVSDIAGKWMFGKKTTFTILNNGVDVNRFFYSETVRQETRCNYDVLDKEVIIHVGAFRHQKNHTLLIKIFKEYNKRHINSVLMLVGDGEQRAKIQELVNNYKLSDKVIFIGQTNNTSALLNAADKFLFPSLYEGFPNALIEAECTGLPCVISDKITKQVCISDLCKCVSLDAPIGKWVLELERENNMNRKDCVNYIIKKGLDINSEMNKLSIIYRELINSYER